MEERVRKVVHVVERLESYGGTPLKLLYQVSRRKRVVAYTIICLVKKGNFADQLEQAGAKVISVNMRSIFDFPAILRLFGILHEEKANVVCTHFPRANVIGRLLAQLLGRKTVAFDHGIPQTHGLFLSWASSLLNLRTSAYVVNSKATGERTKKTVKLNQGNITVVYNGIDVDARPSQCGKWTGPEEGYTRLLAIGGLVPFRDHKTLIMAADLLFERGYDVSVCIVGDGPMRAEITELSRRLATRCTVEMPGYLERTKIPQIETNRDVFVNPAIGEGFGFATVEQMARGCPPVCADAGALPELIHSGEEGYLFTAGDAKALADAVEKMIRATSFERENMSVRCVERVRKEFNLEQHIERIEDVYIRAIRERR